MSDAANLSGLRGRLNAPGPLYSAILTIPHPAVATILGWSGFDYVVIDGEHSAFGLDSMGACIEALANTPAACVVRVVANDPNVIKQTLELGADGIQVPTVNDAAEAAAAVSAAKYPPHGARGIGMGRAARYGMELGAYLEHANGSVGVIAMIETQTGVKNAREIAEIDGIDGIVIGPMDLSADLGVTGELEHQSVLDAVDRVVAGAAAAGTKVGASCRPEQASGRLAQGMTLLTCFADAPGFAAAAGVAAAAARSALVV
jgi:2-keto-3-deoxy-L-rhamnonate aldolase RhmA